MPRPTKTVRIEGIEELIRKIGNPDLSQTPVEEMLHDVAKVGERAAINAISGGTALAERSIQRKVRRRKMTADVYTLIARPRAMSIDKGRQPGEGISFFAAASWLKKTPNRRRWVISDEDRGTITTVTRSIKKHGTKGKSYIIATKEAFLRELPHLQAKAMKRLEELAKK